MNVGFISDFFSDKVLGGAELNDSVLISNLERRDIKIHKIVSSEATIHDILKYDFFIVSNFTRLEESLKIVLMLKKYVIYEHDHKYLKNRDPSKYPNFKAPKEQLINVDFYRKAQKVFVLSEVCKNVIEKNLNLKNVINIGCSLWSMNKISFIKSLQNTEKTKKYCIIKSNNSIKGTNQAIMYCQQNKIDYDLIGPLPEKKLLEEMSKYEFFVFLPQVLETLSRIVVEAKMLNCKVLTNTKLIGAASEKWFNSSGEELTNKISTQIEKAIDSFEQEIKREEITVILNCYRRPEYLEQQIDSIRSQTIQPKEIWIWVNHHEDNEDIDFSRFNVDKVIRNDFNWKFYGRFAGAMLSDTKYVALFDDDTIPGKKWFENCMETMKQKEGILGGAGVILSGEQYTGHTRYGWSSTNEEIVEVDLVGHAWFFKQEWLKYLWMEKPFTWENGEDIQFSYCAQKYGGIKTYCPPHPKDDMEKFSSTKGYELGVDEKATSKARNHKIFYPQRDACVKNAILNGWKIVRSSE